MGIALAIMSMINGIQSMQDGNYSGAANFIRGIGNFGSGNVTPSSHPVPTLPQYVIDNYIKGDFGARRNQY